ncbi:MAG: hypothetical protein AAB347_10965 [Bacteroidota bacterium]
MTLRGLPATVNALQVTVKGHPVTFNALPVTVKGHPVTFNALPVTVKGHPVTFNARPATAIRQIVKHSFNCRLIMFSALPESWPLCSNKEKPSNRTAL